MLTRKAPVHRSLPARIARSVSALVILFVSFPLGLRPAFAGNQTWTGTGPRAKGIQAMVRDPLSPARMWAGTFGAGVYRSLDGGATWTGYRTGLVNTYVRSLAVNHQHPDSLFCGTNDGVYLSIDGGLTWTEKLPTVNSVRSVTIHPVRTAVIYAGTYGGGIYKSIDGGATWNAINFGLINTNVRDVAIHPTRPETLLAASGTGGGVHRSFNGGLTWTQVPDTAATHGAAEQIQYDLLNPNRIYVAELDRGVLKSADGGNTWLRINSGLTSFRSRSLAVVDTLLYVGTEDAGVFTRTINVPGWTQVITGLPDPTVDALLSSPSSPSTVWAGTGASGIFRTDTRGALWTQLDGGILATFGFALAVRPSSHMLYDGAGFGDQVWRSPDQGGTWTRDAYLFTHDSVRAVVPDPVAPQTVYLTAYGAGVYRSTDDGATWALPDSLSGTLGNPFVRSLVAWPGQAGHLFVGTGVGIYESLDGGATWTPRSNGLPASFSVRSLALVPAGAGTLYTGSDISGVYKSTDGGQSWTPKIAGLGNLFIHDLRVDSSSSLTVYAATDLGVYKSTNGGDTWALASTGLPAGEVHALAQDPAHPAALFCGILGGGVFESQNGGQTWQSLFNQSGLANLNVRALAVDDALTTLYAGTDAGVEALSNYPTSPVAVSDPGPAPALDLSLRVWPNPATADAPLRLTYGLAAPARVNVDVFDLTGRHVRTLIAGAAEAAGSHAVTWDEQNDAGRPVIPGVYFLRLETEGGARSARVAVVPR